MKICHLFPNSCVKIFDRLGRLVAQHPKKIIAVSIISTILISVGIFKIRIVKDVRYMIAPTNSRAYEEQRIVNHLFPTSASEAWNIFKVTDIIKSTSIILLPRNGGSVLKKSFFEEAVALDCTIRTFEIKFKGERYNYSDLCVKFDGECYKNIVLSYTDIIEHIKDTPIRYPIDIDIQSMQFDITSLGFGGVIVGDTNEIIEARALRLFYFIDNSDKENECLVRKWENEYIKKISEHTSNQTDVIKFAAADLDNQFIDQACSSIKYGALGILFLSMVCVLSSMTSDWTTSKPLLSLAGCASPGLASVVSLGIVTAMDVPFTVSNFSVPFIITGIGVDDMFVLIAAWRKTDRKESVINRMGETYSHAGISVTMTSLTNLITFLVGASLPIPLIRNFCIQGSFAIFCDWVYQLTFFGACMALDGYREEKNLHPITFTPVVLAQDAGEKTWIYKLLFTRKSDKKGVNSTKPMVWFRDTFGSLMNDKRMKTLILLLLVAYLAGASWGLTKLEKDFNYEDNFVPGSDAYKYAEKYYQYFSKYNQPVQVIINANLDYSNRTIQKQMTHIINSIQNNKYVSRIALNWLKHFLLFTRINRWHVSSYNLSSPKDFNTCLREVFFNHSMGKIYKNNVVFSEDGIHISVSRFVVLPLGVSRSSQEIHVIKELRRIADSLPYSPTLYCPFWLYYEAFSVVEQMMLQTMVVVVTSIFVAFFIFIPNYSDVICSTVCIISMQIGVVGYMAIFGLQLNFVTTAMFVVCIGFCVDSSAHVLNSFALAKGTLEERIRQMYFTVGMPVLQGSFTTLVAVTPLWFVPHYVFRVIFIIVYLQITISFLHAVFVLPTLLCLRDIAMDVFRKARIHPSPTNGINDPDRF